MNMNRKISKDILKKNLKISVKLALLYAVIYFIIDEVTGCCPIKDWNPMIYGAIIFGVVIFLINVIRKK